MPIEITTPSGESPSARWHDEDVTPPATPRTLYVSDLDRTLLRSDGTLGETSVELLNSVVSRGGLFTYATARSPGSARTATEHLRLELPVITYGGTVTAHAQSGAPSDVRFLESDVVSRTLDVARSHPQISPVAFTFEDGRDWIRWDPTRMTPGVERFLSHRAGDRRLRPVHDGDRLDPRTVHYVAILAANSELVDFRTAVHAPLGRTAHFLSSDHHTPGLDWLEFHHPSGTKAEAILRLMTGLDVERLVVFGDNHNDAPMFEIAHEAYAVENAVPELVAIATSVIGHHEHDAVARFIADDFARA